jgi:two-component system, OmpR family, copper resistance phosphate regulon response regulator CusR
MKLLLVEDEPKLISFIKRGLEENGFETDIAYDGNVGERLAKSGNYSVIILDVNLPYKNGFEICSELRKNNIHTPVLMLTALGSTEDKLHGFDAGADDYLIKPFEFLELMARVKALSKRNTDDHTVANVLRFADLILDLNTKTVKRAGKSIDLTAKEFSLLEYFLRNKKRVISRGELADKVWDINFDTGTNVIDVYVNFLRKKIDKNFPNKLIHTQVGFGYILKEASE